MTFKPALWYPIAVGLTVINLVSVPFAIMPGEPWHATAHAVLAVASGLWAQHLRQRRGERAGLTGAHAQVGGGGALQEHLEALETEMNEVRRELSETQERLDFAERMLVQEREARRVDQER